MKSVAALALLLVAAVPTARAAPFRPADVPPGQGWVAHADIDQLRASKLGQHLLDEWLASAGPERMAAFEALYRFDPRRDLSGVTAYGRAGDRRSGVIVVHGHYNAAHLETLIAAVPGHVVTTHRNHTIHRWLEEAEQRRAERAGREPTPTFGCFLSDEIAILGQDADRVGAALDVLDGAAPATAAADDPFAPLQEVREGAFFLLAGPAGGKPHGRNMQSAILAHAQRVFIALGETAGRDAATIVLQTADPQTAINVQQVANGLIALMLLQADEDPAAADLARGIRVFGSGDTVQMQLAYPAAKVIDLLRQRAERRAATP